MDPVPPGEESELPTGTVTLLLGDIEGSTRLWETRGSSMLAVVEQLDALLGSTIAAHAGARPLEQGEGDSFVAAFTLASDAVACALDIQRRTSASIGVPLRMGIHTGQVELRGTENYAGPVINRAARLRDAGHGGQVLLSGTSADLVADTLPDGASLHHLGEHHLKDLARPERIVQLAHPDLKDGFPPLRVALDRRTNLPTQLSSFVGRTREQAELHAGLDANRLVTLTGAGGVGKTRLALQVAADRPEAELDGVWLADLSSIKDQNLVIDVVASAIGANRAVTASALASSIGVRRMVVILDNCEHLIDASAALADELLRQCLNVTVLATSREPLGVDGEVSYRVPSLGVPSEAWHGEPGELADYEAVALFTERARRAKPSFVLDAHSAPLVLDICQRLDGVPLALELAAARARVLPLDVLRDGLFDRFRLLTGGARTAVARQQTLQASVEWSVALLLDVEQRLLRSLSVFAGSFPLDGAERVGAGGPIDSHHVLDLLTHLVDKSLVTALDDGRFVLPETIRQYAAGELADAREVDDTYARLHAWALELTAIRTGETDDQCFLRIAISFDSVRRALEWASHRPDPTLLRDLAMRLELFWLTGRRTREGAEWLRRAWERSGRHDPQVQTLLASTLIMSNMAADARALGQGAVDRLRDEGDPAALARALLVASQLADTVAEALAHAEEAHQRAVEVGNERLRAWALFHLGFYKLRDDASATDTRAVLEEAVAAAAACGFSGIGRAANAALAFLDVATGEVAAAIPGLEEAIDALRTAGEGFFLANALVFLIIAHHVTGDDDRRDARMAELRSLADDMDDPHAHGMVMMVTANLAAVDGDHKVAADHFGVLAPLMPGSTNRCLIHSQWATSLALIGEVARARAALDEAERARGAGPVGLSALAIARVAVARAEGHADSAAQLARDAATSLHPFGALGHTQTIILTFLAAALSEAGRVDDAARMHAAAGAIARAKGIVEHRMFRLPGDPLAPARDALGPERWAALVDEGRQLDWDGVVAYLQRGRGPRSRAAWGWQSLTPTEHQVVELVIGGATNKEVATRLVMSVPTVKSHLTHAYAKLGVTSRTTLAALAAKQADEAAVSRRA